MIELKVKACANGLLAKAELDVRERQIVIFGNPGVALGYIDLDDAIQIPDYYKRGEKLLKEFARTPELRPCLVKNKKAFFHKWVDFSGVVPPSIMVGGAPGGTISGTFALIEYEDGTLDKCHPAEMKFLDRKEDEK